METNTTLLEKVAVHDEEQARMHAAVDALFNTDEMVARTSEFDQCEELKRM